jgi:putative MATE family efflux protein
MDKSKKPLLINGPVGKTLIRLTGPMIVGIVAMMAFNLVDTYFVGHLGTDELAAMSFTFPVIMIIASVALGLGIGASAVISRAIGEGDQNQVKRLTTDSLLLAVSFVTLIVITGLITITPLFTLLGATPKIMPLIKQYMLIWYPGMIFVVVPMVGNNAIRATGDTKTPSLIMLLAVAVNGILDPLLIFGYGPFPRLELAGAAIATVIARTVTLTVSIRILYHREKMLTFKIPSITEIIKSWKRILYIALPTAGTNIIIPISVGVITRIIADYGPEAVAGFGVASRIETFVLTIIMALYSVLGPFIGQNWGAGKKERVRVSVVYSQRFAMLWGAAMFILLAVTGKSIASLFNKNPQVVTVAGTYLLIVPIAYGLHGVLRLSTAVLNVLNRPFHSALLILTQAIILYIPLALIGSHIWNLKGIFSASVLSFIITGLAAYLWLKKILAIEERSVS